MEIKLDSLGVVQIPTPTSWGSIVASMYIEEQPLQSWLLNYTRKLHGEMLLSYIYKQENTIK